MTSNRKISRLTLVKFSVLLNYILINSFFVIFFKKNILDDNETKSPLAKLFRALMPSLRAQYKAGKVHGGRDPTRLKKLVEISSIFPFYV